MAFEYKLPDIGEGVHEGEIVQWLVAEGDRVEEDQDIVEVMTDKATVQLSAPRAGTIATIHAQEGDIINVGDIFVVIDEDGGAPTEVDDDAEPPQKEDKTLFDLPSEVGASSGARRPARAAKAATGPSSANVLATPKVRHEAKQRGIDLATVTPTGAKGHVTLADLESAGRGAPVIAAPAAQAFDIPTVSREHASSIEPLTGLRKRIAANMVRAKTLQAHYTYVVEVRADKLVALRDEMRPIASEQGVKLSFLPLIVKAVVRALKRHPRVNALIDENTQELVLQGPVNVGIAAATEKGLVVPVVQRADEKSVLAIAGEIETLGAKARDQKLSMDDITGGTFTITSLGKMGGLLATPILLHPQVAIMGVHAIRDVPVVENGEIVPGKLMNLAFTFDHRVIDGYDGAMFANDVAAFLEEPGRLLLESV